MGARQSGAAILATATREFNATTAVLSNQALRMNSSTAGGVIQRQFHARGNRRARRPPGTATAAMPGSASASGVAVPTEHFDPPQPFELLESFDQHHVDRAQLRQEYRQAGGFRARRRCGPSPCPTRR